MREDTIDKKSEPISTAERMRVVEESWQTSRTFEQYKYYLGCTNADMQHWNTVVDLGAGDSLVVQKEFKHINPNAHVISVNPKFGQWTRLRDKVPKDAFAVAMLAQEMAFADESIDAVLALFSVPLYLYPEDQPLFLKELIRILAPGGEAFLYPVGTEHQEQGRAFHSFLKEYTSRHPEEISYTTKIKDNWLRVRIKKHGSK